MAIIINTPFTKEAAAALKAGDEVLINGIIYTARDAAHKRLCEAIDKGETPPFNLMDAIVYYVGPTPARPGRPSGSAGPTTSYRMDPYAPKLLALGLRGMVGKGLRGQNVVEAMKEHTGVYFVAVGGAGALIGKSILASEVIAYDDLGSEAIHKLTVQNFPATVVLDCMGNDLYEMGKAEYLKSL